MTDASRDQALMALRDEFGLSGYGVYWLVIEAIAEQMNPGNNYNPAISLSTKNWRKITEFSPKKFQKFVVFCSENNLFSSKTDGLAITIKCDKLLKIKDDYSRKSVAEVRTNSVQCPNLSRASTSTSQGKGINIRDSTVAGEWIMNGNTWNNIVTGEEVSVVNPFEDGPLLDTDTGGKA